MSPRIISFPVIWRLFDVEVDGNSIRKGRHLNAEFNGFHKEKEKEKT